MISCVDVRWNYICDVIYKFVVDIFGKRECKFFDWFEVGIEEFELVILFKRIVLFNYKYNFSEKILVVFRWVRSVI